MYMPIEQRMTFNKSTNEQAWAVVALFEFKFFQDKNVSGASFEPM